MRCYKCSFAAGEIEQDRREWGALTLFYEIGDDSWAMRQIEVYENGTVFSYDESHQADKYGILADQKWPHDEVEHDPHVIEISSEEFEQAWDNFKPKNR